MTVIQYDKIVVMKNGEKIEEGSPKSLINSGGYFAELIAQGGEAFVEKMKQAAEDKDLDPCEL